MPDVEFLHGDASGSDDEFLDTGPRRRAPRRVLLVGVLVVVGLIVFVLARHGGGGAPVAAPSAAPARSSAAPTVVPFAPDLQVPEAYALTGDDADHRLFALSGSRLFAFGLDGRLVSDGVPVHLGVSFDVQAELLLDTADHVVYAVPQNATGNALQPAGSIEAFDARTLRLLGSSSLPGRLEGAAVLGRSLFLTTRTGLYRVPTPGSPLERLGGHEFADNQLVADPARHRLISLAIGRHVTARVYRLGRSAFGAARRLSSRVGPLAVVGRTIWTSGLGTSRPELAVLNPTTLQPGPDLAGRGGDVGIEGTGHRSLLVTVGDRLRCLDGSTGQTLHDFGHVHGDFAAVDGRGFTATISAVRPVAMGRCPG